MGWQELEKAKRTISVLENELSSERSRLRTLIGEQDRLQREKKQILTDLQRTESVSELPFLSRFFLILSRTWMMSKPSCKSTRRKIRRSKRNSGVIKMSFGSVTLAEQFLENANIEQKARLLETRVVENAETIEQLREERNILAVDHKELQRRFAEVSEV